MMSGTIEIGLTIFLTFAGIAACIVGVAFGLTLIKKKWPDVWD